MLRRCKLCNEYLKRVANNGRDVCGKCYLQKKRQERREKNEKDIY